MKNFAFILVIENIKNPNLILSGGVKNKFKGAYKKIFNILNEDFVFVEFESEDEELIEDDLYLYFNLTPDLEKLHRITKIPNVKIISQTYSQGGLVAPNGKPSNLTPEQYKLVRTPAFKKWFGDWENDPTNSSKVVDDNGEPLVVYHGTPYGGFYEFDLNNIGKSTIPYWGNGIYLTASKFYAKGYAENKRTDSQQIYNLFAKCLNPYIVKRHLIGKDAYMKMIEENQYNDFNDFLIDNNYDSVIILDGESMKDAIEIMTPLSNQIKLSDGTNTTFDSNNNDIRFEQGGETKSSTPDYLRMFLGK